MCVAGFTSPASLSYFFSTRFDDIVQNYDRFCRAIPHTYSKECLASS